MSDRDGLVNILCYGKNQRDIQLAVVLEDVELTARGPRGNAGSLTPGSNRIWLERACMFAVLEAGGKRHPAGRELKQVTGDVARKIGQGLLAVVALNIADEVEHFLGDRTSTIWALTTK